jgi:hypothetical protein
LVIGVIATVVIVWMADVKEKHWDELRRQSDERIAEANARQKEAELKLQRLRRLSGPREILVSSRKSWMESRRLL